MVLLMEQTNVQQLGMCSILIPYCICAHVVSWCQRGLQSRVCKAIAALLQIGAVQGGLCLMGVRYLMQWQHKLEQSTMHCLHVQHFFVTSTSSVDALLFQQ